jgi:hypothetical protein
MHRDLFSWPLAPRNDQGDVIALFLPAEATQCCDDRIDHFARAMLPVLLDHLEQPRLAAGRDNVIAPQTKKNVDIVNYGAEVSDSKQYRMGLTEVRSEQTLAFRSILYHFGESGSFWADRG